MRTSFRAALTDWKCVVQKSGCSIMIEAPCYNEAYICVACYAENARRVPNETSQANETKRKKPSKAKQAEANGKELAVFSRNSSRRPVSFFLHKSPHEPFVCEMCRGGTMNRHQPIQQNI